MPPRDTALIAYRNARKVFGDVVAIDDLSLDVAEGEIFVLLGRSGCGKSTALQLVNRMLDADAGRVLVRGADVQDLDAVSLRRSIGYVIQQIGLFPHRTVAQNVGTVCGLVGWDRSRTQRRVGEMLEMVGLAPGEYADRYPHQLSGGQQQRVGVARALAVSPPVLLMDEPFGALDPEIRRSLQQEFRTWVRDLGTTVLFVTHDVDEATVLADRMAVMGPFARLDQVGRPVEVLGAPASADVASFLGGDRILRRLSVLPITVALDRGGRALVAPPGSPVVGSGSSLHEALLSLISSPSGIVSVTDAATGAIGAIDWDALADVARDPTAGAVVTEP